MDVRAVQQRNWLLLNKRHTAASCSGLTTSSWHARPARLRDWFNVLRSSLPAAPHLLTNIADGQRQRLISFRPMVHPPGLISIRAAVRGSCRNIGIVASLLSLLLSREQPGISKRTLDCDCMLSSFFRHRPWLEHDFKTRDAHHRKPLNKMQ